MKVISSTNMKHFSDHALMNTREIPMHGLIHTNLASEDNRFIFLVYVPTILVNAL